MKQQDEAKPAEEPMPAESAGYASTFQGDGDDDEAMQLAIAMSMAEGNSNDGDDMQTDEGFVNDLVGTLPGVDPNDPRIRDAMKDDDEEEKGEGKKD